MSAARTGTGSASRVRALAAPMMPALLGAALLGAQAAGAQATGAQRAPRVTLTVPYATAGSPFLGTYSAAGLRRGDRLQIQRRAEGARRWQTVAHPSRRGHEVTLPALQLGSYEVRIAAYRGKGKLVAQQARALLVFGRVPLLTLLAGQAFVGEGTRTAPTTTFHYMLDDPGAASPVAGVSENPCRRLQLEFLPFAGAGAGAGAVTLTLVREGRIPLAVSAGVNAVGTLNASLAAGHPWSLNASLEGTDGAGLELLVSGYAECYRASARL